MADGIKIADFFAKMGFKVDDKNLEKINTSVKKIETYLNKTGMAASRTGVKLDKAFKGEALLKQRLSLKASHEALIRLGGGVDKFNKRLASTKTASGFLKLKNEITASTIAMRKLNYESGKVTKPQVSGKPSGVDLFLQQKSTARMMEGLGATRSKKFEAMIRGQSKALNGNKIAANKAKVALESWARMQIKATRDAGRLNSKLNTQQKVMSRLKSSTGQLAQAYLGAFAVFQGVTSINRVGQDFEGMRAAMLAASGTSKLAKEDLAFVDKEVVRLGLDLKSSTDAFTKLQFAAKGKMSREETRSLFVGFSEFATALKVGPEQANAGLRAMQQMLNKTTVMSEELKQQLAEQVPGSIQVFAKALNVSEDELFKMMEKGTLLSKDVLPKVAKQFAIAARGGGALGESLKSVRVQQGRFITQIQKVQDLVFRSGFGKGFSTFLSQSSKAIDKLRPLVIGLGKVFRLLFESLGNMVTVYTNALSAIGNVASAIGILKEGTNDLAYSITSSLAPAFIYLLGPLGKILFVVNAVVGAVQEFYALTTKGVMADFERTIGKDLGFDLTNVLENMRGTSATGQAGEGQEAFLPNWMRDFAANIVEYVPAARVSAGLSEGVANYFSGDITVTAQDPEDFSRQLQEEYVNGQAQR